MILNNLTRRTVLTKNLKEAKTLGDKFFGLLLKKNPRSLLLKTRFGIHTFFLKDSIDVIVIDDKNKVAKAQTVKPNSIFVYHPKDQIIIELPLGTIERSKTKTGDTLSLKAT